MEYLIDKDALVAEIERRKQDAINNCSGFKSIREHECDSCIVGQYEEMEEILNTLEVKEVDLDKELESWRHNHFHGRRDKESSGEYLERITQLELAKHFFELGMAARTDKELVEEVYSHIDGIKDTADRMTSGNFMHNRAAIKFSANTIAKVLELIGLKVQEGE